MFKIPKKLWPVVLVATCLLIGALLAQALTSASISVSGIDWETIGSWVLGLLVLFIILFVARRYRGVVDSDQQKDLLTKMMLSLGCILLVHLILWMLGGEWYANLWSTWPLFVISASAVIIGTVAQYHRGFAYGLVILGIIALLFNMTPADNKKVTKTAGPIITTDKSLLTPESLAVMEFLENPVMILVGHCESKLHHFQGDGKVLVRDGRFVGLFQIDTIAHKELIADAELDPYNPEDNVKLARILFDAADSDPMKDWGDSSACWGGEKYPPANKMFDYIVDIPETEWSDVLVPKQLALEEWGYGIRLQVIIPPIQMDDNLLWEVEMNGVIRIIDTETPRHLKAHGTKMRFKVKDPKKKSRTKIPIFFLKLSSTKTADGSSGTRRAVFYYLFFILLRQ